LSMGLMCMDHIESMGFDEGTKHELKAKDEAMKSAIDCLVTTNDEKVKHILQENEKLTLKLQQVEEDKLRNASLLRFEMKHEIEKDIVTRCEKDHSILVDSLKNQIDTLQIAFTSLDTDRKSLQDRLDKLNEKLPHMNMVAMGNLGEELVEEITRQAFNYECDIISSAKESHCMDMQVTTPSGFHANLEIKTAIPIQTARDVNKYHRDLHELIERSEINASALISLKAPIPNFKSGTLVFKTNPVGLKIPVMYIQATSNEILKHSLSLLKEIQVLCNLEHTARGSQPVPVELEKYQEEKILFKQVIPDLFKDNAEEEESLCIQLDHMQRIKEISENRLAKLKTLRQCKIKLQDQIPWLFNENYQHTTKLERGIRIWEQYKLEHKKDPERLNCFGADEPFIKNIGYARLKEAVREFRRKEKEVQ
jgi:hypothetical protein